MKRKIIIILGILILILVGIYVFFNTYKPIINILENKNKINLKNEISLKKYKNYAVVRCNLGLLNIEYSFIAESRSINRDDSNYWIGFYNMNRDNIFSKDWNSEYTGGTTISNTTFPQLLKMVKEDCYQFQKDYNNPEKDGIDWGYRKYQKIEKYEYKSRNVDDIHMLNEDGSIRIPEKRKDGEIELPVL